MGLIVEENQGGHFDRYPRGIDHPGITNTCYTPWSTVTIDHYGDCFLCKCAGWLPKSVGNIDSMSSLLDIWNNPTAISLQQDINDKKFTICAVKHCGISDHNINPWWGQTIDGKWRTMHDIHLSLDETCNLACPSCRSDMINVSSGPLYESRLARANHVLHLLSNFKDPAKITMMGSGDPLASLVMRPIILNWEPTQDQLVTLFTNGLLIKKLLPISKLLPNIYDFWISVDAGSKEVYENVRRPGKYEVLRENLDWLAEHKPKNSIVKLKFTLSDGNATDIINFCNMCNHYNFLGEITNVDDWRSWSNFQEHEVFFNTKHPLHTTAIEQLREVSTRPYIEMGPMFSKLI